MATKRKHEGDSIAGRLTKRLKTETVEAEKKFEEVWKSLNQQLGAVQYPTMSEEEVDQWENKFKDSLENFNPFDRSRFKFPAQLREYLKLTGKSFKDYTDHSQRKELLQDFYGNFIEDLDKMFEHSVCFAESFHCDEKSIYWFSIAEDTELEESALLVNCDTKDDNFGGVYYGNFSNGLTDVYLWSPSLTEFFQLLIRAMKNDSFIGFSKFITLDKWINKKYGEQCEIDTLNDSSWKLIDATTRSKPVRELIESETGTVYVPLFLKGSSTHGPASDLLFLQKDSYGQLMLHIEGRDGKYNTQVKYDASEPVLLVVNKMTGMGRTSSLNDFRKYVEHTEDYYKAFNVFMDYQAVKSILGADKLDLVRIDQFWLKSATQQS